MGKFRYRDWSLKWKSLIIFMLMVTIPTSVLGVVVLHQIDEILRVQAVESTEQILDTLSQNISSIVENVEDISSFMIYDQEFRSYMTSDPNELDNMLEYRSLLEYVNAFSAFHVLSKPYISSIELQGIGGVHTQIGEQVKGKEGEWIQAAKRADGGIVWSGTYTVQSLWTGEDKHVITLLRQIHDINDIQKSIGLVRIRLDEQYLDSLLSDKGGTPGNVFIVNSQGEIVTNKDKALLGLPYQNKAFREQIAGKEPSFSYKDENGTFLTVTRKIENPDWYLVALVNRSEITNHLDVVRTSFRDMVLLSILMGFIAMIGFFYLIISPILELTTLTRQVEQGNFHIKVNVRGRDEIGKLGNRFNKMIATIQRLIDTKYKLEIQHRESELKALQNQIDPHFLYNTLDMIRWTARLENAKDTGRLIEALSRLFRISLSRGKYWISLKEELDYVKNYLILQEKRLGQGLSYSIYVDPAVGEPYILKKTIQPLVENCIVHGFPGMEEPGAIEIRCMKSEGKLYIDVSDNGRGFSSMEAESGGSQEIGKGFALRNIRERLALLFGPEAGVQVLTKETKGALVRIVVPFIRTEQEISVLIGKEKSHDSEDPDR